MAVSTVPNVIYAPKKNSNSNSNYNSNYNSAASNSNYNTSNNTNTYTQALNNAATSYTGGGVNVDRNSQHSPYAGSSSTTTVKSSSSTTTNPNRYAKSDLTNSLYQRAQNAADYAADIDFDPSERLTGYANKLQDVEDSKPEAFQSKYTDTINSLLDSILNEKSFSYTGSDMMNDDLYKAYSDQYEHNARLAMQNAQGNAAAQTGGYGSTYSQAAGQQAYDETMSGMNDIALQLADKAYTQYLNDRQNRYNQLSTVNGLDNTDYSRYRDTVGDWQLDRDYYAGRYDNTYAQEYNAYRDDVADAQNIRDYYSNMYQNENTNDLNAFNANMNQQNWEQEYTLKQNEDAREAEKWALQKQQMELALAQAAAGGSSGGSSGRRSSGRSSSGSGYDGTINVNTATDIARNVDDTSTAVEAYDEAYLNYYTGKIGSSSAQGKAQALQQIINGYMQTTGSSASSALSHFKSLLNKNGQKPASGYAVTGLKTNSALKKSQKSK